MQCTESDHYKPEISCPTEKNVLNWLVQLNLLKPILLLDCESTVYRDIQNNSLINFYNDSNINHAQHVERESKSEMIRSDSIHYWMCITIAYNNIHDMRESEIILDRNP